MELIKEQSRTEIKFVPFDGNAAVMMATVGGHVAFSLIEKPSALPHIKGGTLKALAVAERDEDLPGVMTFAEQGIRGDFNIFRAIYCRRDMPREKIKILEDALSKGLNDKSFLYSLQNAGYTPGTLVGEDFRKLIREEENLMRPIVERISKKETK
jgi:tripartite-type tricarboxylate transporter receptor subunit TctC